MINTNILDEIKTSKRNDKKNKKDKSASFKIDSSDKSN
jgi:hypothetical protein